MAWTYDVTTNRGKVRFMVGDTDTTDQLLTDAEVDFLLGEEGNNYLAAASAAKAIAAKYSRQADRTVGDLSINASQRAEAYLTLAIELEVKGRGFGVPFAGGVSIASKQGYEESTDLMPPRFYRGLHEVDDTSEPSTSTRDS